ncbi:MAG: sigma-70 family RNA polymerase sigma factor, partial [Sedimentisphaerales bacterium]|nr:sigma-70 family RNA polymerase sigma factor [Sedimentisphaerales bacterium]
VENSKYYTEIKRYITANVRNPADAEDLAQQAFLKFYQSKSKENSIKNHKAYLNSIARAIVADYYRVKKKKPQFVQLNPKLADNICDIKQIISFDLKEIAEEVENIISKLPPKTKEAAELILIEKHSYEQAAQKANCPVQVFYERCYEGMKILKKLLKS